MHDQQLSATAIISVSDFKAHTSQYLQYLREQGPLVLTQNGKSAGVLMSPETHDELYRKIAMLGDLSSGLSDVIEGRTHSHEEVKKMFLGKRKQSA